MTYDRAWITVPAGPVIYEKDGQIMKDGVYGDIRDRVISGELTYTDEHHLVRLSETWRCSCGRTFDGPVPFWEHVEESL